MSEEAFPEIKRSHLAHREHLSTRASILTIRLAAIVVMMASVAALWNFMLWLPWHVDVALALAAAFAFAYKFEREESR